MEPDPNVPNQPPPEVAQAPPRVTPPPVIAQATPRPPRRGGGVWMILAIIAFLLLGVSFLVNLSQFASGLFRDSGAGYTYRVGPRIDEVLLKDKGSSEKIVVVDVRGIITSDGIDQGGFNMVELFKAQLKRAAEDRRVKAVVLSVNSPGGEVLAADEMSRAITDFQKKSGKPIVAAMGDLAASGGYYVSAPCRWIVANELTLTGSIGVILSSWNYRGLMDKVGVVPDVYKSGKYKDMLSGSRDPEEVTPEERRMLQAMVDKTFARFREVVVAGRNAAHGMNKGLGRPLRDDWQDYADGRVLTGSDAYDIGFVDELGNFDDAVDRAEKLARVSSADLIQYRQHYDLSDLFRLFGKNEGRTLKVDLGVEPPKLKAGQLYFLSPTYIR